MTKRSRPNLNCIGTLSSIFLSANASRTRTKRGCKTARKAANRRRIKIRRVLPFVNFEKAKNTNVNTIYTTFKRLFPNHHTHELRYNFITRAKEAECNLEAVMLWAGHSFDKDVKSSAVDRGYTDYSQEYLVQEAQKIDYIL